MRKKNCKFFMFFFKFQVKAHKSVLAACSPYFCAMFTGFDEKNKSKITLQDVDPHALEILVNYVYTSEVDVTEDNVQTLLPAANLMQLSGLLEEFSTQLRTKISKNNSYTAKGRRDFGPILLTFRRPITLILL